MSGDLCGVETGCGCVLPFKPPRRGCTERHVVIDLDQALAIVRGVPAARLSRTVDIGDAWGRVLAREVTSLVDSPPFDKSAMDGFAVDGSPDSTEYRILDTVPAGEAPHLVVRAGECARIMTGAMLPPVAARVIRKEFVREADGVIRPLQAEPGDNVIRRGANLRAGDLVLGPRLLGPQDIGILAASGIARVEVAVAPTVGVICTGPEIREPGAPLSPGQIYNSNGPQLQAQLASMRCPCLSTATVEDEPGALSSAIEHALATCDVVLLTGGVSEGDFDYVPACLEELGAEILFHHVAVKPGKPTLFARRGDRFVFGLPGNPVSTFVTFEIFVKPFLYRRMGIDWNPPVFRGMLAEAVRRRSVERAEFLPVRVRQGRVTPVEFHGSSHLNALGEADGLIRVEKGISEIPRGTEIDVRPV
jgi:molybdopterin molybdotransferase